MNSKKPAGTFLLTAVIIGGFAAVYFLSGFVERARPPLPENYTDQDLALQGSRLKGYALGFEGLIADWYWMQSLQYIGDKILKNKDKNVSLEDLTPVNPRLLYPYLDNATTLDPQFTAVYAYGAMVLPTIDAELAIRLTEKGIAENPDEWQLYHYLGYIYWKLGRYDKAAEIYAQGARIKGAPEWMLLMAGKTKADGGSRDTARTIYRQMFEQASDSQSKEAAALRLLSLDSLDERDEIKKILEAFQTKNRRCANNFKEIFQPLAAVRIADGRRLRFDASNAPVDPTGVPYVLNNQSGKCAVTINFAVSKLPE